jgi:DNA-directed RNA polymerase subunit H (RpoH/RPB5)
MTPYENYLSQMKHRKASLPYMSEKDFCEAHGLKYGDEETLPIFIARKSSSAKEIKPTLKVYITNG